MAKVFKNAKLFQGFQEQILGRNQVEVDPFKGMFADYRQLLVDFKDMMFKVKSLEHENAELRSIISGLSAPSTTSAGKPSQASSEDSTVTLCLDKIKHLTDKLSQYELNYTTENCQNCTKLEEKI